MDDLTPKQRRFVDEYLIDLNATAAAIRAGYAKSGAHVEGARMLKLPKVNQLIDERRAERSRETQINAAWLLKRLAEEATADVADLYDENTGSLKPVHEWPKIWRLGLVAGIDTSEEKVDGVKVGEIVKVKISDRVKRLELIGRHIGVQAFKDVVEHKGLEGLGDRLERARKRLEGGGDE